ncbi:MAG: hypothetical protein WKF80_03985 [Thermomicrobiales bacterium]
MDDGAPRRAYSDTDLDAWVDEGLIGADQAASIRVWTDHHLALREPPSVPSSGPGPATLPNPVTASGRGRREDATGGRSSPGERLQQIAYYIGGFTIFFAFTFFVGLQWESLSGPARLAIVAGVMGGLVAIGATLRRAGALTGGNVLIFGATGMTPLLTYEALEILGIWGGGDHADTYPEFYRRIDGAWLTLEIVSVAVAVFVVGWVRFPLITLLIAFWTYYLSMDVAEALWRDGPSDTQRSMAFAVVGLAMVGLGLVLDHRGLRPYTRWFWLFGLAGAQGGLGALALQNDRDLLVGLGFLAVSVGWVVASVWLSATVFLVFGALGIYAYVGYLAFSVFDGALGFIFTLAAVGLFLVLTTFAYARVIGPWLDRTFRGERAEIA